MAGMDNEPKKISFGFNKSTKKPNIFQKELVQENKIQLIEYVEEQSIKIIGGNNDKPKELLVIPMKHPNKKLINLIDIVKNDFNENDNAIKQSTTKSENIGNDIKTENLSLEEQAAQELLNESHNVKPKKENKLIISNIADQLDVIAEKESTLEDYESIPIEQFGKAMLRGMGWKDGQGIGKNEQLIKVSTPLQRPKGMGLGADKVTKQETCKKATVDRDGNVLKCVKGAFVKVIAGYHKGNYGQIIGFDDESGRFIIKMTLSNLNVSLNEFLVVPVTKEDYSRNSKVINNAKYEEYQKKKQNVEQQKLKDLKKEKNCSTEDKYHIKKEKEERESSDNDSECKVTKQEINDREIRKGSKSDDKRNRDYYKKKEKELNEREDEYSRSRKSKSNNSKYDSDDYYQKDSKDKKHRDNYIKTKTKYYSDDSVNDNESNRSKKKSSKKHNSGNYDDKYDRRHHRKEKKIKTYDSDESSDDNYQEKSKKNKKYIDSDSEYEEKNKKLQNKEKHEYSKRSRSRHDRKSSR